MNESCRRYLTIPNMLSSLRIKLVVPIVLAFNAKMFMLTVVLFLISALSDALDGIIARRWKMESDFGRVLDPLADKITFVTLIAVFGWHVLPLALVIVLIVQELALLCMGACTYFNLRWGRSFSLGANKYGKMKTGCETLLVLSLIVWHFFSFPQGCIIILSGMLMFCIVFAQKSIITHFNSRPLF
ncbi:MAG: CDP-alcohol phosphatidyltransferase family protein [bacterium]|nr:CDP-alcohol phosphatidyltransferase family protein [bacterium]MDZ4286144.1 CDP-alcohol phosphatidyltransferase family protein [Candidatus Sungbacteria bacterium]